MIALLRKPGIAAAPALLRMLALATLFAAVTASAAAQGHPGGGPPGGGMGGPGGIGMGGGMGRPSMGSERSIPFGTYESHSGLRLGFTGRWWDNKDMARTIGLNSAQQKRMDEVFAGNRDNLMTLSKNLQHEESQLEKLSRSRELDENQIFQQIDRVTQARGELDKAYAHYLLQIRREMTPQQVSKMDDLQSNPSGQ
jgi:Spy/CpxP family protein refolding chaperone